MSDKQVFPVYWDGQYEDLGFCSIRERGLMRRELFAAMAMQGLLANPGVRVDFGETRSSLSNASVKLADALIAKLDESRPADAKEGKP
jgi:hypothetical protein